MAPGSYRSLTRDQTLQLLQRHKSEGQPPYPRHAPIKPAAKLSRPSPFMLPGKPSHVLPMR